MDNKFKIEILPHKFGNFWVRIYRSEYNVGTDFYLTKDELEEFCSTMKMKIWEYYKNIVERHPEEIEEQVETPVTYRIGQIFETGLSDFYSLKHNYLLSEVSPKRVILINLSTGIRWSNAIDVEDSYAITEVEMRKLVTEGCTFKHIK